MAENRFIHPRLSQSERVSALDDFTFRVWIATILHADDFGILPASPATLRGASFSLQRRSEEEVELCFKSLTTAELLLRFEHQNRLWLCHPQWQDFQKIRYPRTSYYPVPTSEILQKCSRLTSDLFLLKLYPQVVLTHANANAVVSSTETEEEKILQWLNQKAGRSYRRSAVHLDLIRARLAEGIEPWQLRAIVSRKVKDWGGTDMAKYLRPATLFNRTKCEQYIGELPPGEGQ